MDHTLPALTLFDFMDLENAIPKACIFVYWYIWGTGYLFDHTEGEKGSVRPVEPCFYNLEQINEYRNLS